MLLTVKSVVATVEGFPSLASWALAWLARYSCTAAVNVPVETWDVVAVPAGTCQGAAGYFEATGYVLDETSTPTATGCQCGSVPRGPRFVGVPRPWDQNPKAHSDEKMIIHPKKAAATTR